MKDIHIQNLQKLICEHTNNDVCKIEPLPKSGSDRLYYRIYSNDKTWIGVYNPNKEENICFIDYANALSSINLNVPSIIAVDSSLLYYITSDLGNQDFHAFFLDAHKQKAFPEALVSKCKQAIDGLIDIQVKGNDVVDYSKAFPIDTFNKRSIMWDLNYFKYYMVKAKSIQFNENRLEDDFNTFADWLLKDNDLYFMYRDFQSRNIMWKDNQPWFIDFQGGRKGPLQYDLASFLNQVSANIPEDIKDELIDYYTHSLNERYNLQPKNFKERYYGFVLFRLIQVLGAYGFRGLYEKKPHFLKSLQPALEKLREHIKQHQLPFDAPELYNVLTSLCPEKTDLYKNEDKLNVTITSFSFLRSGIPSDTSNNGGGFVFDCRFLPNPGRYQEYKESTGRDQDVIEFFHKHKELDMFLKDIYSIAEKAVENYIERKFTHLMFNFGCTGGQHRSVYCAEQLTKHLMEKYNVIIKVEHVMQSISYIVSQPKPKLS
ncbi:MAG: phosphotransferase [Hyphomicrobiales bacterium]